MLTDDFWMTHGRHSDHRRGGAGNGAVVKATGRDEGKELSYATSQGIPTDSDANCWQWRSRSTVEADRRRNERVERFRE
jgi:hypothetical protein